MENLTKEEMGFKGTKFTLSRMKTLRNQIPTVTIYARQMFLPSGHWCTVFKFKIPLSMVPMVGTNIGNRAGMMQEFTVLGAPGAFYPKCSRDDTEEKPLKQTYEEFFRIRGTDLVQPFFSVSMLSGYGGGIEISGVDREVYEGISRMSIADRRGLILRFHAVLESGKGDILQTARVYGVMKTLERAEHLIRCAEYDAEEISCQ